MFFVSARKNLHDLSSIVRRKLLEQVNKTLVDMKK